MPDKPDLSEAAILETVVPAESDIDLQELFQSWDPEFTAEQSSIVPFIEQRQFLLLDEVVPIYIVLRIPATDEDELKTFLSKLSVTIEAQVVGQLLVKPGDAQHPPQFKEVKELLASEPVNIHQDPLMLATELQAEGDDQSYQYIYLFWKTVLPIGRAKQRLQKVAIYFTPSATYNPNRTTLDGSLDEDEYLPSMVNLPANLFEQLTISSTSKAQPYLSASRLGRMIPHAPTLSSSNRTIRCGPRKLFRAAPAFLWRVRFLPSPTLTEKDTTIACFDIEPTAFANANIQLSNAELRLSSGHYEAIGVKLPITSQPGEQIALLYKIFPPKETTMEMNSDGSSDRTLTVTLTAIAMVSKRCLPTVKIKWKTTLETPPSRPPSRNLHSPGIFETPISMHNPHDALTMTSHVADVRAHPNIVDGVSIAITAPDKIVAGKMFTWQVLVINRSTHLHRLALIALPKRKHTDVSPLLKRPRSGGREANEDELAAPLIDDNVLYTIHKNTLLEPTDLICLTPDIKVGPLGPSACFQTELQFLPLAPGALHFEGLRLINLASQQSIDIFTLPAILAHASTMP